MAWEPRSPFIGQEFPNWFGNVFRKSTADILLHDAGRGLYSLTLLDLDSITRPESFLLYNIFEFERNLREI